MSSTTGYSLTAKRSKRRGVFRTAPEQRNLLMKKSKRKGIFCLEGDWWGVKDTTTVEPVLKLLESYSDTRTRYIHRDVGTVEEFDYYLDKWSKPAMSSHPILYLGFHGSPGIVYVGSQKGKKGRLTLELLAERLEDRCRGRLIHFGSCGTLAAHGQRFNSFLRRTGAAAVCGYKIDVDWLEATVFDLLLLGHMQYRALRKDSLRALERDVRSKANMLAKTLNFRMVIHP